MSDRYTNESQQRIIKLVLFLFNDVAFGYPPAVLAREMNCSAAVMTRDLNNLQTAGIAERDENTGHWRLTPRLPQQALKALSSLDRAERRIAEVRQRLTRNPD
jgi:DNA-binding IclR family transcriptional regulator